MGRRSAVARLDPRIRAAVDAALREGRATIDELVALIQSHGASVSRSAVGRYRQRFEENLRRYREAQEVAGQWVAAFRADPDGDVGRLLAEMLKTLAFASMADRESADPRDIHFLARAIRDLASSDQVRARLEAELRAAAQRRAEAAVAAIEAEAETRRLSPEVLAHIRQQIYGIVDPPRAEAA
jgi:hypothetical protein